MSDEHRHPRCVTPSGAQVAPARAADVDLIRQLNEQLFEATGQLEAQRRKVRDLEAECAELHRHIAANERRNGQP